MLPTSLVMGVGFGVWSTVYFASHYGGAAPARVIGSCISGLFFLGVTVLGLRIGVRETTTGLVSAQTFRRQRVDWEDIVGFEAGENVFGYGRVLARRRSGPPIALPLVPGKRVRWRGGSTDDPVAALTERLAQMTTGSASGPPVEAH